jgi:threonine dehydrogenase-like Zn-dependent dehydrogenase
MYAIEYVKSIPRYLTIRLLGKRWNWLYTSSFSSIRVVQKAEPKLPSESWVKVKTHLSGICGSDLATICAKGSPYFSPLTSCPFVLGHEVVGIASELGSEVKTCKEGDRVVIEPALSCVVRGIPESELCYQCRQKRFSNCENVGEGRIAAGVQTGYCRDTGGGWSSAFLAHESQLHQVPDELSDEEAVLIEPFSCAIHAAKKIQPDNSDTILVLGCGTIGLLTIAALRGIGIKSKVVAVAKHPHQQELAKILGADEVLIPNRKLYSAICELTAAKMYQPELGKPVILGGVNYAFDCVGSANSIDDSLRFTRAQGTVILVGMPAIPRNVDWTSIWHKELKVIGSYTYGLETHQNRQLRTFELAMQLLQKMGGDLKPLISAKFSLSNYKEAIQTALHTGKSRSVKVVFEL